MNWIFLPFTASAITAFCEGTSSFTCQTKFGPRNLPPCSSPPISLNCQKKVYCDDLGCGSGSFYPCGKP